MALLFLRGRSKQTALLASGLEESERYVFAIGSSVATKSYYFGLILRATIFNMLTSHHYAVIAFSTLYLLLGGGYFIRDFNLEFVIYVAVIVVIFLGVFTTLRSTQFPVWMLWLLSFWGLMHVAGGLVQTVDGVLFAYKMYPFMDYGGDFYILKYDQVVHTYLYALVALMSYHVLRVPAGINGKTVLVAIAACMISVGISGMNEIMEFLIAITLERNGVGGYENAMLDLIFNFSGAAIAVIIFVLYERRSDRVILQ